MKNKYLIFSITIIVLLFTNCNGKNEKSVSTNNATDKDSSMVLQIKNTAEQIYSKPQIPILCYHRITDAQKGDYCVSPTTFKAQIKILSDSGYHSILPNQLFDYLVFNKTLPEKPFMITFDDSREEHSQIAEPVLEKYGFKGVFFIMTITYNKKNYMTTDQIAQLAKAGHVIGLHSWDHTMVTKYMNDTDWQKQVVKPKEKLEKIVNQSIDYWAYPNGVYNHESTEELSKYFKLSFSLATKRDSLKPLQAVRRMIVPEWTPTGLLKSMRKTFNKKL